MVYDTNMPDVVVIISAGGVGKRLFGSSGKGSTKSMLLVNGKPLIAYQIANLLSVGLSKIHISFNINSDVELFNAYLAEKLIPHADYTLSLHPYGHSSNVFQDPVTLAFVGKSAILWTAGDTVPTTAHLTCILKLVKTKGTSVVSVIGNLSAKANQTIHFPLLLLNKDLKTLLQKEELPSTSLQKIASFLRQNCKITVAPRNSIANINTVTDLNEFTHQLH